MEEGIFIWKEPKRVAESLRNSVEAGTRRKTDPFRSATSILVFYIKRS
ncbi:DUF3175 domain-containing protein [Methylosarcina fibrata]